MTRIRTHYVNKSHVKYNVFFLNEHKPNIIGSCILFVDVFYLSGLGVVLTELLAHCFKFML